MEHNYKNKNTLFLISFGVILYAAAMNLNSILHFLQRLIDLVFPILLGLLIAFILNVPMKGIERRLTNLSERTGRKMSGGFIRGISLLLTLASIVLVITLAFTMAIPAIVESAKSIQPLIEEKWPEWIAYLKSYQSSFSPIFDWMAEFDFSQFSIRAGSLLGSAVNMASSTISGLSNVVFGLVVAIYVLLSKNILAVQVKKLFYAHLEKDLADRLCQIAALIRDTYSRFLFGQTMEAILLGCLIFISFRLFGLPYAALVAFLTSLFAFIPYIGAFAACFVGTFLTLLASPSQVLLCIVVYMVVQFIENQFIYPHVVGTSVGLSPLWTLIAALIGGKLFGLPGIIFFIPLVAVLYTLIGENTNRKLLKKGYL